MAMIKIINKMAFLCIAFLMTCGNHDQQKNKILTFDLTQLPKVTPIKLSDLGFKDVEYIPLETTEKSMISHSDDLFLRCKLIWNKNYYVMLVPGSDFSVFAFKHDGKFYGKVGKRGRGPDEYSVAHDINVDEKSGEIYLLARWEKKMFVFSQDGRLVKSLSIPFSPSQFCFADDKILCYNGNNMGDVDSSFHLINKDGRIVKCFANKYPFKNHDAFGMLSENLFYQNGDIICKKEVSSDTVYSFENEFFNPRFVIYSGSKLITPEVRSKLDGMEIVKNYIEQLNLFEFGDYVYYEFVYRFVIPDDVLIYSYIGSKSGNFRAMYNTGDGMINDLDGGPNFHPMTVHDDNILIGWIDALKLKKYIASGGFKNSTPKYPEKKKELETLAVGLKETDNPVLVIVK
jgi:hypothetical protein